MKLKDLMKKHRAEKDTTQKQLAEHLGITRQNVCNIERGQSTGYKIALKAADHLGFKRDDIDVN